MAARVDFQKITPQEVVVKISGIDGDTATISLAEDLFPQGQIALRQGIISVTGDAVTGTGTAFAEVMEGGKLYDGTTGAFLGVIDNVASATAMTLAEASTDDYDGVYGTSYKTQVLDGDVQTVSIVSALFTGTGVATIERGEDETTLTLNATYAAGVLEFGSMMIPDRHGETEDIDITIAEGPTQIWLKLRKVGGWSNTIETAYYSSHDDETVVGS